MFLSEILAVEHSNYPQDPRYTAEAMQRIRLACQAVTDHARQMGIEFSFSRHFFDQIKLKRGTPGANPINERDIMSTSARILNRGLTFFKDKEVGTDFAFADQKNDLIMPVKKMGDDRYQALTVVRDYRWAGRSQKILL